MKTLFTLSMVSLFFLASHRIAVANPPVLLWHRDFQVSQARISGNGTTVAGYFHCGYGSTCEFDPGTLFVLDGASGTTLWQMPIGANGMTFQSFFVTADGQKVVVSQALITPQLNKQFFDIEKSGPYVTNVHNRDGTTFSQMPGAASMVSGDGTLLYLHGIHVNVDPEQGIWNFKQGTFRLDGTEVWSQPSKVGGIPWFFTWGGGQTTSNTGNLVVRECYFYTEEVPSDCFAEHYRGMAGLIANDGLAGTTLLKQRCAVCDYGPVAASPLGNYILFPEKGNDRKLIILRRDSSLALEKEFAGSLVGFTVNPQETRVAVCESTAFRWMDFSGNILWTLPTCGDAQISANGSVMSASRGRIAGGAAGKWTDIIDTSSGQVLHTFSGLGTITSDGLKAIIYKPSISSGFVELWDLSPLFQ